MPLADGEPQHARPVDRGKAPLYDAICSMCFGISKVATDQGGDWTSAKFEYALGVWENVGRGGPNKEEV